MSPFVVNLYNIPKTNDFIVFFSDAGAMVCFLHLPHMVSLLL